MAEPGWAVKTFGPGNADKQIARWLTSLEGQGAIVTDVHYFDDGPWCKVMARVAPNVTGPFIKRVDE